MSGQQPETNSQVMLIQDKARGEFASGFVFNASELGSYSDY